MNVWFVVGFARFCFQSFIDYFKALAAAKVSSTACLGPGALPTPFRLAGFAGAVGLRLVGSALGPYE